MFYVFSPFSASFYHHALPQWYRSIEVHHLKWRVQFARTLAKEEDYCPNQVLTAVVVAKSGSSSQL